MNSFVICAVVCGLLADVSWALRREARGGRWSLPTNWCPEGLPEAGDDVLIDKNVHVLFDTQTPRLGVIDIVEDGLLEFEDGAEDDEKLILQARTIMVRGVLRIGSPSVPFVRPADIVLLNLRTPVPRSEDATEALFTPPYGAKMLAVVGRGTADVHARGRTPRWAPLNRSIKAGDTEIELAAESDWQVGDTIVLAPSDYSADEAERRVLTAVSNRGRTLVLDKAMAFPHFGEFVSTRGVDIDMRAEVMVQDSNVRIYGDMEESPELVEPFYEQYDLKFGGHIISVDLSTTRFEGVELFHLGQKGRLARYPFHWHHRKYAPGNYIKRCAIHTCFSRSITVHDTHQVVVQDNAAYDTFGHMYYLEDGTETLNQFIGNLGINPRAVGTGSADYTSGSFKFPLCSDNPPGIRLQFLDHEPSVFWLTNANNTLVRNHAVGGAFGYWVRVEPVFNEPRFAGVGCTVCREGCREVGHSNPPEATSTGMVWFDNFAHSASKANFWIKENWVPRLEGSNHPLADDINILDGFTTYKSPICVDIYGIGSVFFDHVYAADCAVALNHEWQRRGESVVRNSILVGETRNFGSVDAPGVRTTECSPIWPGVKRTRTSLGGLPTALVRQADGLTSMLNVVLVNRSHHCDQNFGAWDGNYRGAVAGSILHTNKFIQRPPPAHRRTSIEFDQVTFYPPAYNQFIVKDDGSLGMLHGSGFLDESGTWPCSEPGSQWLFNAPSIVTKQCEYRSNWDMFVCPPFDGRYISMQATFRRQFQSRQNNPAEKMTATWECNSVIESVRSGTTQFFELRTDKLYVFEPLGFVPNGIQFRPLLGEATDNDQYPGVTIVVKLAGRVKVSHFLMNAREDLSSGVVDDWVQQADPEQECHCDVTYVKLNLRPDARGVEGDEIRIDADSSISCDTTCGNPFPIPDPVGYSCNDQNPTSDSKDFDTCEMKQLTSMREALKLGEAPQLPVYELDQTEPISYSGVVDCAARSTPSCASANSFDESACDQNKQGASGNNGNAGNAGNEGNGGKTSPAATPPPQLGGLEKCKIDSDCKAGEQCYGEHCIRPTSSCVPGSAGCRCDSNDACEAEHECKNLPDVKLNVCLRKDVKKLAGMLISPNSTDGNAIGYTGNNPEEDLYKPLVAPDLGCVRGDAGCLCTTPAAQCAGSHLACVADFCVQANDCAGELGCACIRAQCLGGALRCARLAAREICVEVVSSSSGEGSDGEEAVSAASVAHVSLLAVVVGGLLLFSE